MNVKCDQTQLSTNHFYTDSKQSSLNNDLMGERFEQFIHLWLVHSVIILLFNALHETFTTLINDVDNND